MQDNKSDLLERLAHPELEEKRLEQASKNNHLLFIRNILNFIFIVLALVTMGAIGYYFTEPVIPMWCFLLGVIAVIVKMFEAFLRMPYMNKQNHIRYGHRSRK